MSFKVVKIGPGHSSWPKFLQLPHSVYRNDPNAMLENSDSVTADLSPDSPFNQYSEFQSFIATRSGEPVSRVTAILNKQISPEEKIGMLGYFEAIEDSHSETEALVKTAVQWLGQRGVKQVLAPLNFNTWHRYRFVDHPSSRSPFLLEPYNPGYYSSFFQQQGFEKHKSYYSSVFDIAQSKSRPEDPLDKLPTGIHCRALDRSQFERDVKIIHTISKKSFGNNPEFMPIDWDEFWEIYKPARRIAEPAYVRFLEDSKGSAIAFAFAYRDQGKVLRKMQHQPRWVAPFEFLLNRGKARTLVFKSLGVLPEYQGARLGSILSAHIHTQAKRNGMTHIIHALMEEDNLSRRLEGGGTTFRTYSLYRKEIS